MKKLFIICSLSLLWGLMAGQTWAITYCKDVLENGNPGGWKKSLKTWDDEITIIPGQRIEIDIWINNAPGAVFGGGFYLNYSGSEGNISFVSCQRYLADGSEGGLVGPWDPQIGYVSNLTPGKDLLVYIGNLDTVPPDSGGDIIIAKVVFEGKAFGDASFTVSIFPGENVWSLSKKHGGNWPDNQVKTIPANTFTIHQKKKCKSNDDCDDGLFCNGAATCVKGTCVAGSDPCPDDGLFCNGTEICNEDTDSCISSGNPCPAGQTCNETTDSCKAIPETSTNTHSITPQSPPGTTTMGK